MNNSWRSIALLAVGIALALISADLLMGKIHDEPVKRQVRDGLQDLASIPNILAVSSSHGRSFHILGQQLEQRTSGRLTIDAIALESGKVDAMEWVLSNRLKPVILDESGAVRQPLSHLLFGITWWDTCRHEEPTQPAANIVTHGWALNDYLQDVRSEGATALNRNYVRNRWRQIFEASALVRTRFAIRENYGRFSNFVRVKLLGGLPQEEYQITLDLWNRDIEKGHECYLSDRDMQALDRFVDFAQQVSLELTIVLFPLKPDTITEKGMAHTIKPFSERLIAYGKAKGVRVLDMTAGILDNNDFMLDLDHVNAEGNIKWSEHVLDTDLGFLAHIDTKVSK